MTSVLIDRSQVPEPGPLRPFRFPDVERFVLSNGLPVYFAATDGMPVVTFSLLMPGGALRESSAEAGLATLTASLLESGTSTMGAEELSERLESLGVRLQVGASWEVVQAEFTALTSQMAAAAQLVASVVREPAFPADEFDRLRNQHLAAILQRRAEPRGFATELAYRYIFSEEAPYSRPVAGLTSTISDLTRDRVAGFHSEYYSPSGAALVIAGRLDMEEARATAEHGFGGWTGPALPDPSPIVRQRREEIHAIIIARPGAVQSEIRIGHLGVQRNNPDYFAINVMNTILGGAFSSRLNLNLREKHGFTYGVRSSFVMRRRPGPFIVSTAVQTEVTGAATREIITELERIRNDQVTEAELEDARQYVAGTFPLPLQTTDGVAARLAELFIYDLPDSYFDEFPQRTAEVSREDVLRVARQYLGPEVLTIVVLGDPEIVRPQLEGLGIGSIEVVAQEEIP